MVYHQYVDDIPSFYLYPTAKKHIYPSKVWAIHYS